MKNIDRLQFLRHYNHDELVILVGNNEKQISVLHSTFMKDFSKALKNIRNAVKKSDKEAFIKNALIIEEASKSVCYEIMEVLAIELQKNNIDDMQAITDGIEEMENELEIIKEEINCI
ncbi:MAG TPA: hypothetical protein PKN32_13000 [Bacteroidales bacterium]|nr:hypothetical protein [Bacteroidales bacterium]